MKWEGSKAVWQSRAILKVSCEENQFLLTEAWRILCIALGTGTKDPHLVGTVAQVTLPVAEPNQPRGDALLGLQDRGRLERPLLSAASGPVTGSPSGTHENLLCVKTPSSTGPCPSPFPRLFSQGIHPLACPESSGLGCRQQAPRWPSPSLPSDIYATVESLPLEQGLASDVGCHVLSGLQKMGHFDAVICTPCYNVMLCSYTMTPHWYT